MKSSILSVYSSSDIFFGNKRSPHAEWPHDLIASHSRHFDLKYSCFIFKYGSREEKNFLDAMNLQGHTYSRRLLRKFNINNIHEFPFYHFGLPKLSYGFEGDDIYENQRPCGLPPSPGSLQEHAGCGELKRQIRKLCVSDQKRISKADIFTIFTLPFQPAGRTYGISRRLHDLLIKENLKGFELVPILEKNLSASDIDLSYDHSSSELSSKAKWFQMTIKDETKPIPVTELFGDRVCAFCGAHSGWDQPDPNWSDFRQEWLSNTDIQICSRRILPDGKEVYNRFLPTVIVSSKFLKAIVENKISGTVTGSRKWGMYRPVNIIP